MKSLLVFALISPTVRCLPAQEIVDPNGREKRQSLGFASRQGQASTDAGINTAANCDFNIGQDVSSCGWSNLSNATVLSWVASSGKDAYWIGGPRTDASDNSLTGGYGLFETSTLPESGEGKNTVSAMVESPLLSTTGSEGHCVSFSYAIEGLSADRLRVLLHPVDILEDPDSPDFEKDVVLATLMDDTRGKWKKAQVLYTYPSEHTLILEAIPKPESSQARRYRGYFGIDDIEFNSGDQCKGHCTFDSGLCGFTNDVNGNFNWEVGRGSDNPNTGPQRDHSSFTTNRVEGAFAYIDAGFPRRTGDKAQLVSDEFPATDSSDGPMCLRFWTHMFGNGIGALNVYVRSDADKQIWGLTGDAGNNWYMGQAPVASTEPYRIVFEGLVGRNTLGNIAVDDISVSRGVCPTAPQVAARSPGDCAFEDDECGWSNPERRDGLDELNWERTEAASGGRFPLSDHTTGREVGFYMQLSRESVQRAGDRAFFISREVEGSSRPKCMSFWYYMHEPIVDTTGPNLGKLAIWTRTVDRDDQTVVSPVWRLHNGNGPVWNYGQAPVTTETNFQVIIEGVWGNNRASGFIAVDDITFYDGDCSPIPDPAHIVKAECTFDRDSCGWRNTSTTDKFDWRMATLTKRPANLPDKTYGAPAGYAYFDIFNTGSRSNKVKMISPTIRPGTNDKMCFSFWFAAFGAGDSTSLRIIREELDGNTRDDDDDEDRDKPALWALSAEVLDTARPEWSPGQVSIDMRKDFRLVLEGKASNGGFAIDQLTFSPGDCGIRPEAAVPKAGVRF